MKFHGLIAFLLCLASVCSAQTKAEERLFKAAMRLLNSEQYRKSIPYWEKLVSAQPQKPLYWYNLGSAYFGMNNYEKALPAFNRVVTLKAQISPLAQFYVAKSEVKLKRSLVGQKIYESLLKEELPPNIKKMVTEELHSHTWELGRTSYKEGHYEVSLQHFELALSLQPTAEAAIMKAFSHLRLGEPELAREALNLALTFAPPTATRDEIQFFIRQIKENIYKKRRPYWAWVDLAVGHNSNFYENGATEENAHAAFGQLASGIGYHFFSESEISYEPSYLFSWQEIAQVPGARIQTHTVQLPTYYNKGAWFINLMPYGQDQHLAWKPFLNKLGLFLKIQQSFGANDFGILYDQSQSYAQDSFYDYLNGSTQITKVYWSHNSKDYSTNVFLANVNEFIGDLPYSNGSVPLAEQVWGGGFGADYFPSLIWNFYGSLAYYQKDYFNDAKPDNKKRSDTQTVIFGKLSYIFSKNLRSYLSHEMTVNRSTLSSSDVADKNFNKFVTFLGLTWTMQ